MSGMSVDELCKFLEKPYFWATDKAMALDNFLRSLEEGTPSIEIFNQIKAAIDNGMSMSEDRKGYESVIKLLNLYNPQRSQIKEMAHVLGLKNNPDSLFDHEGWGSKEALASIKSRYKTLSLDNRPISVEGITRSRLPVFLDRIAQAKFSDYIALVSGWELHAVSVHVIQDKDLMHFVYVNRGGKHLSPSEDLNRTVIVYSCDLSQKTEFARLLYEHFSTEDKATISAFLESSQAKEHYNPGLSRYLDKHPQAVGNCTLANTNITWHFHLATQLMKQSPEMSLSEAYEATKREYKKLRVADRVEAFIFLLKSESAYKNQAAFYRDLMNVMAQFRGKEGLHMEAAVDRLSKDFPELLSKFFEMITSEAFNLSGRYVEIIKDWSDLVAAKLGVEAPSKKQEHSSESGSGDAMTFSPLMSLMSSSHTSDFFKRALSTALLEAFLKESVKKDGPAGGSDFDGPK